MAEYSVADINHDSTTRIPSSTSWVAPHGKQGASYEELCGYWPFSKRMFTPVPRWSSHTYMGITKKDSPPVKHAPDVGASILSSAANIHMLKSRGSRTFQDYAQQIFIHYLLSQLESVDRVDIVWDRYLQDSLKQSTRECRMNSGTSLWQWVLDNAPIPPKWENFLQIKHNNDEMFHYRKSA